MDHLRLDFISVLIFLGLVQGLFLSILFVLKKGVFNRLLSVLLFLMTLMLFDFFSAYSLVSLNFPHLLDISVPLGLLVGPVLYFMGQHLLNRKLPRSFWLHLLPFIVFSINQGFYYAQSGGFKYNSFITSRGLDLIPMEEKVVFSTDPLGIRYKIGLFTAISLTIYAVIIIRTLVGFYTKNKLVFWHAKDSISNWIKKLGILFIGVLLYVIFNTVVEGDNPNTEYVMALILTAVIYFISFEAMQSASIISKKDVLLKYRKSRVPLELRDRLKRQIQLHMDADSPYLESNFSLKKLAENIGAHPNYVSQTLNGEFGQSYHEFVALYRIAAAKKYLRDPKLLNTNIEQISEMVGYNSKASFNKAFKALTGQTPFQFRKG